MAVTTVQTNNKLVKYTKEINREAIKENMFSAYTGDDVTSIIRRRFELKEGGEQMNVPMVGRLKGRGKGSGTLVGNEESIDNYGFRGWIDWSRNAVTTKKSDQQKDSADIFGEAKPLLSDWQKEKTRDELIAALLALPSESTPSGLGSDEGDCVNGIRYEDATATQRNTWNSDNSDRVYYAGQAYQATHATALGTVTAASGKLTYDNVLAIKKVAEDADPLITPWKTKDGYENFVLFAGSNAFRDLKKDLKTVNQDGRPREEDGYKKNPLFMDGDLLIDGVIIRKVPQISKFVTDIWTTLKTAGDSSGRLEPVFLCGQQAAAIMMGQMIKPTFRKEDDYGFITGSGVESAYGVAKLFRKPQGTTKLVQTGVVTGFVSAAV